jgi:hypothetical protein
MQPTARLTEISGNVKIERIPEKSFQLFIHQTEGKPAKPC